MATETVKIELTFISDTNETIKITIPRAKDDLTESEAKTLMGDIILTGIVVTGNGKPNKSESAELVRTETTPII